jgi:glyoxylase-like metal-dependent hydrolase (beta-lactamase superfamily II)
MARHEGTGDDWFTEERVDESTFVYSEYGHEEETHCYLLIGSTGSLLIDTGMGIADLAASVARRADPRGVQVVATHAHWDHIGSHGSFGQVFVHGAEAAWLREDFPLPLEAVRRNLGPEHFLSAPPPGFDPSRYGLYRGESAISIADGHVFDLGNRRVRAIHAPGHSPGHMVFLEDERGYLFSGDLLYRGTIFANYPTTDPAALAASLRRISALKGRVCRLLPGHHGLDVGVELIDELSEIVRKLEAEGGLRHGSGLASGRDISLLL